MSTEYIGEKIFLREIKSGEEVWVAKSIHNSIHAMEFDQTGFSLPVWSSRERVEDYLKNARLIGPEYRPHAIPLDVFTNAWLSDKARAITELQINPDGKSTRTLALTSEEFQASQSD